jgi:hypothetical protein
VKHKDKDWHYGFGGLQFSDNITEIYIDKYIDKKIGNWRRWRLII